MNSIVGKNALAIVGVGMVFQSVSLWWRGNGQCETTASDMSYIIERVARKESCIVHRIEI